MTYPGCYSDQRALARLRWQCRRGMLELDFLLTRFLSDHYAALSAQQKQRFEVLLTESDPDLFAWCTGRATPMCADYRPLITLIRQADS
jgi:antitoxin CptB